MRSGSHGYAVAIGAVLLALALRALLPGGFPFLTFYPAVILTAYFCGPKPAILCAVLSGLTVWLLVLPTSAPATGASSVAAILGLYALVVSVNLIGIGGMQRSQAKNARLSESQRILTLQLQRETELRVANQRLAEKTLLLDLALQAADAGTWRYCVATGRAQLSERMARHNGFGDEAIEIDIERDWRTRVHPEDAERTLGDLQAAIASRGRFVADYRVILPDGRVRWIAGLGQVEVDEAGTPSEVVGLSLDITARKEAESKIAHLACHDPLTGLANRTLFHARLGEEIARAVRRQASFALFCLDLDRFKAVNDTHGHLVGDALLQVVAARILGAVRQEDTVARFGGDEFVIIQTGADRTACATVLAERLIGAVREPIEIEGHSLSVGLSIGIAMVHAGDDDSLAIYRRADRALYRAKAEGRSTFRFAG
ncbi:diguanylate cyclase domain-containing protein [Methylobacterium sp. NEAU K]|uniref:diguanylate cyclase domain-containing protein n=1 Tax=Methylobacterium sp. NEAU K TaxID=3064946 RepID=UPI002736F6B3|nr:diguanylate cyclase [Methylobacterium sp. NEAU K]MDP4005911.1 diguanylate cyclase [Methylobacterium sp. NEAU K]